ncbi:intracellular protein transport protein USO1, partial [Reticulomyxa filosa]
MKLQLKGKKDEEIAHLKQQLEQFNSTQKIIIKQKITLAQMEILKKDIHNKIQKIKQEMQVKEKQIMEQQKKFEEANKQINNNKEEQKENIMNDNSSISIINRSFTFNFELVRSFKLINTFTGQTSY